MAAESKNIQLGFTAPGFRLKDVTSDRIRTLDEMKSAKATVIMFICNHCPYVKHVVNGIVKLADDYLPRGVSFIAVNSNDVEKYPEDSPEKMMEFARAHGFRFPYLFDETQEAARAYDAACTPDFYVFNREMKCVYHGQMDNARPGNNAEVTGSDLRAALDHILAGREVPADQKVSIGCSIKRK
ncbi:MAG: thioredoxin family protein [Bacteroidales bacterium]|nr:thioredoxin family protein [Bacteroidales bacterium]